MSSTRGDTACRIDENELQSTPVGEARSLGSPTQHPTPAGPLGPWATPKSREIKVKLETKVLGLGHFFTTPVLRPHPRHPKSDCPGTSGICTSQSQLGCSQSVLCKALGLSAQDSVPGA